MATQLSPATPLKVNAKARPQINPDGLDIWGFVLNKNPDKKDRLLELRSLIQAPKDGYLIIDVLRGLTCLEKDVTLGIQPYEPLQNIIKTANWLSDEIQTHFPSSDPKNAFTEFKAFQKQILNLKQCSLEEFRKNHQRAYVDGPLWREYKTTYSLYVALFFPYIEDDVELNPVISASLNTFQFIKAQSLKLLLNNAIKPVHKTIKQAERDLKYKLYGGLVKSFISESQLDFYTTGYHQLDTARKISRFLTQNKFDNQKEIERDHVLKDALKELIVEKATQQELQDIKNAKAKLISFFKCGWVRSGNNNIDLSDALHNLPEEEPTDEDLENQEEKEFKKKRKEYDLKMGLVLSGNTENLYEISNFDLDDDGSHQSISVQIITETPPKKLTYIDGETGQEISDIAENIPEETLSNQLIIPKTSPCEISNPNSSVVTAKSILPHITYANLLIRSRIPDIKLSSAYNRFAKAAQNISEKNINSQYFNKSSDLLIGFISLLLGRDFVEISFDDIDYRQDSISLKNTTAHINLDEGKLLVTFPHYLRELNLASPALYQKSTENYLILKLSNEPLEIIKVFKKAWIHYANNQNLIFIHRTGKYKDLFVNIGIQTPWKNIKMMIQRQYSLLTNGDLWSISLFTGISVGVQATQKHYASMPAEIAQSIFDQFCLNCYGIPRQLETLPTKFNYPRIGSAYFVKEEPFKEILKNLRKLFKPLLANVEMKSLPLPELATRFNAAAIYCDLFCAFCCAIRDVTDPIIDLSTISTDGLCRVNDKNKYDGMNTRITYASYGLREFLKQYSLIRSKVLIELTKRKKLKGYESLINISPSITKQHRLLTLSISATGRISANSFTRTSAKNLLLHQVEQLVGSLNIHAKNQESLALLREYKNNSNRHYLRGKLLERGMLPNYVDAYLGHWHAGTMPWGQLSLFDKSKYYASIKTHIPEILKEVGFHQLDTRGNT